MVSADKNANLTFTFFPEEIDWAIMEMKASLVPGLDGLPATFFQKYQEYLQAVIMPIF